MPIELPIMELSLVLLQKPLKIMDGSLFLKSMISPNCTGREKDSEVILLERKAENKLLRNRKQNSGYQRVGG